MGDDVNSDELDELLERRKYLTDWLERNKKAQEMLPFVQQELELTELNIAALTKLPDEADEIPREDLSFTLGHENQHLRSALPIMPLYNREAFQSSSDEIISGSTATMTTFISRVGDIGTEASRNYADCILSTTKKFKNLQSRPTKVHEIN